MANGNIKVSTDELAKFSILYGISSGYLLGTQSDNCNIEVFTIGFEGLSEQDQEEILNLIAFNKQMDARKKVIL